MKKWLAVVVGVAVFVVAGGRAEAQGTQPAAKNSTAQGAQKPRAETRGKLRLIVRGGWANVFVDGQNMGRVPPLHELSLPAGQHKLELLNAHLKPYRAVVTITPGQTVEHEVRLVPAEEMNEAQAPAPTEPSSPPPDSSGGKVRRANASGAGTLRLLVRGWATIYVDGKEMGRVPPLSELSLPVGLHKLELINPAKLPYRAMVNITAGETLEHTVTFEAQPRLP